MLLSAAAFAQAVSGAPAPACEALALRAFDGPDSLLSATGGLVWSAATIALLLADSAHTAEIVERGLTEGHRSTMILTLASVELFAGIHHLNVGDLDSAITMLQQARYLQEPWGAARKARTWAVGFLARCAFLLGDRARAWEELGEAPARDDESDGANIWRATQADLLLAEGRAAEALEVADHIGATSPNVKHPSWKQWHGIRARALAQLDRRDEALEAMHTELELARACETPSAIGRALRQLGEIEGEEGIEHLEEAVEVLRPSSARLERARALAALGGALRRARRPTEAREPLRGALELAEACSCPPLVEEVRSELYAAGARPRTVALRGLESLTARELRVATLAAEGHTNRDIAQTLFVTPKTVEVHLSNAYRKLDIGSRRELPAALAV